MISYVKLKNFISFGDVTFDFRDINGSVKNFAAIYGENGSGKTNFVKSIQFLVLTLMTFPTISSVTVEDNNGEIKKEYNLDFSEIIKDIRTLECQDKTEVEYGFKYKGHDGIYRIAFDDELKEEYLYYWTGKQRGVLFHIYEENKNINVRLSPKLIVDKRLKSEMLAEIERFWGKHTFLGLIKDQIKRQNESYTKKYYMEYLLDVIYCFHKLNVITKDALFSQSFIVASLTDKFLEVKRGVINKAELETLERTKKIVKDVLTQAYADIKNVDYEIIENDNNLIEYRLVIEKMISGKVRRIPIALESSGTHQILNILTPLIGAICGMTVFIDEADTGIHDLLFKNIVEAVYETFRTQETGQLIITTHNTTLLETLIPKNVYFITTDYLGNKEPVCMDEFNLQKTNNPRKMYLQGNFGGIPTMELIDLDDVMYNLDISVQNAEV